MIYIVSSQNAAALGLGNKSTWAELLPEPPSQDRIRAEDQVYLDISSLSTVKLKKTLESLGKNQVLWGIIDPEGTAEDPAAFFFEGASDYIGPALVRNGLTKKRFAAARSRASGSGYNSSDRKLSEQSPGKTGNTAHETEISKRRKSHKLPAGKFEGWKSIHAGTEETFFFLFVSLSGKSSLRSQMGETAFSALKNRLRELLQQGFREADALLWMETEDCSLFLVPPRAANGRAAVEAALKMILNSRIIGIDKLHLSIPVDFTFALHYGKTVFRAPGKTGEIISEPVNYVFHLGSKKAEPGRLTVSDDAGEEVIPEGILDLFTSAGIFEGIPIRHSRRFVYEFISAAHHRSHNSESER